MSDQKKKDVKHSNKVNKSIKHKKFVGSPLNLYSYIPQKTNQEQTKK